MKRVRVTGWVVACLFAAAMAGGVSSAYGSDYRVDPEHSFVEFRVQHLGFSWLYGRFNTVSGEFTYDPAQPAKSTIAVTIETGSVDTRHAERDKHLRSKDFLHVKKFPVALFKSSSFTGDAEGGVMEGLLTLHGVSKPVSITVKKIGEGKDPWKGYRAGFVGSVTLNRRDFAIDYDLGPKGDLLEFDLSIEGIRQ